MTNDIDTLRLNSTPQYLSLQQRDDIYDPLSNSF